jgi:hypothetical protein
MVAYTPTLPHPPSIGKGKIHLIGHSARRAPRTKKRLFFQSEKEKTDFFFNRTHPKTGMNENECFFLENFF